MPPSLENLVQVIDSSVSHEELPLINGAGKARVVLWPAAGARYRTMHILDLLADDRTVDFRHAADCVWYAPRGAGNIRNLDDQSVLPLTEGAMLHIDAGDSYRFEALEDGMTAIGGPVPADQVLYETLKGEAR